MVEFRILAILTILVLCSAYYFFYNGYAQSSTAPGLLPPPGAGALATNQPGLITTPPGALATNQPGLITTPPGALATNQPGLITTPPGALATNQPGLITTPPGALATNQPGLITTPPGALATNQPGLITTPPGALATNQPGLITTPPGALATNQPGLITTPPGALATNQPGLILITPEGFIAGQLINASSLVSAENILPIIQTIYQLQQQLYHQVHLQQQLQLQKEQLRQTLQLVSMTQFPGGSFLPMIEIGKNASSIGNNSSSMTGVLIQIQSQLQQLNFRQAQQAQLQQSLQLQQGQLQQSLQLQQGQLQQLRSTIEAIITNRTVSASVEQGQEKPIAPQVYGNTSNRTMNATTAQNQPGSVATTMTETRFEDSKTPIFNRTSISPLIEKKTSAVIPSPSSYEDIKNSRTVDLNATRVLQNHSMSLGPNVKNFFILIPNEAHHGPDEEEENRLIDQPFIPSAATINKGTAVTWLNSDVDHEHVLSLVQNRNPSVNLMSEDEDEIDYGDLATYVFNTTGDFTYADTNTYDEGFKMTGRLAVVDPGFLSSDSIRNTIDTVGALVVPAEDLHEFASKLKDIGLNVYSVRHYEDPTYMETQVLIIWTSSGQDFKETVPELRDLIHDLPYS